MTEQELTPKEKQEVSDKEQTRPGRYFSPETDIYEDEQNLWLSADMPGVDQSNVQVELDDNVLTLHGRVDLEAYAGLTPVYTEYNVGHYLRRFTLVDASIFDQPQIKARMVDGVLEVQIPKAEKAKARRIPVSAN